MKMPPEWILKTPSERIIEEIRHEIGISYLLARILVNRGYDTTEKAYTFLNPDLRDMYDPSMLPDIKKAINRLIKAKEKKEKVLVFGDYDVDGISATVILVEALRMIEISTDFFIPERKTGYGLTMEACKLIPNLSDYSLIITVDCGITSIKEVEYLHKKQKEVIITDHHEPGEKIPEAIAVVNPKLSNSSYPFQDICGATVAYKVVWELFREICGSDKLPKTLRDFMLEKLAFVCMATICDIVPLIDENRILVKYGLKVLNNTSNIGIKALCEVAKVSFPLSVWDIAMKIGPRINAAGRINTPLHAVELFLTKDTKKAMELAHELNSYNYKRQSKDTQIFQEAKQEIENKCLYNNKILVVASDQWSHSIVGITASKLTEEYHLPTIIFAKEDNVLRGSGRSIPGVNLYELLSRFKSFFEKFGGHPYAIGLTIKEQNFSKFLNSLFAYTREYITSDMLRKKIEVEIVDEFHRINIPAVLELKRLEPFGTGNEEPIFGITCGRVIGTPRTFGEGKHLEFYIAGTNGGIRVVGFGKANLFDNIKRGKEYVFTYIPRINTYYGENIEFILKEIFF